MPGAGARPTFLVIGAQKAATTAVYELFRAHPDVFVPEQVKETNYLIDEGAWDRGIGWYEALFAPGGQHTHRGDISPAYTMFPLFRHAPGRAAALMPDARIIYLLRHPVDRMVSAWAQLVGVGHEHRDLHTALLHEAHYSQTSCYGLQLGQWLAHFSEEAVLVLRAEDLRTDPGGVLDQVLDHLGLPLGWRPDELGRSWNRSEDKVTVPPPVRAAAGALQSLGADSVARALGPHGRFGRRLRRALGPHDRTLPADLADELSELFVADAARLRTMVGPDLDLWGLA